MKRHRKDLVFLISLIMLTPGTAPSEDEGLMRSVEVKGISRNVPTVDQHGIDLGLAIIHGQNGTVGKKLYRRRWRIKPAMHTGDADNEQTQQRHAPTNQTFFIALLLCANSTVDPGQYHIC